MSLGEVLFQKGLSRKKVGMTDDVKLYYIWLAEAFGQASTLAVKVMEEAGGPEAIFYGKLNEFQPTDKLSAKEIERAKTVLKTHSLKEAKGICERCNALGIDILTPNMSEYPNALKYLPDMPIVLYVLGKLPNCNENMTTAVVGTRKMTEYGRSMAYSIGVGLTFGGSIVVSGMALGSDSMALVGALDYGGCTIAVLGSGVDVVYPREHYDIYRRIIKTGAVISEYPPGTPPIGSHFPVRNRIMSGISDATVVVEADSHSGSLITAARALDQGKKVFAVPGKIGDAGAEGTNALIRDGALTVLTAEDILTEFEFIYPRTVSVQRAHSMLRGMNMEDLSKSAMARTRIGSRVESANYYGSGSYGGRLNDRSVVQNAKNEPIAKLETPAVVEKFEPPKNVRKSIFGLNKEKSTRKSEKQNENSGKKIIPAKKIELDMLDENEIKVYNKMKPSVPTLPDELVDAETPVAAVLSALTMLEMAGAVESGKGGYFMRVQPDDIMQSEND